MSTKRIDGAIASLEKKLKEADGLQERLDKLKTARLQLLEMEKLFAPRGPRKATKAPKKGKPPSQ